MAGSVTGVDVGDDGAGGGKVKVGGNVFTGTSEDEGNREQLARSTSIKNNAPKISVCFDFFLRVLICIFVSSLIKLNERSQWPRPFLICLCGFEKKAMKVKAPDIFREKKLLLHSSRNSPSMISSS